MSLELSQIHDQKTEMVVNPKCVGRWYHVDKTMVMKV